MKIGSEHDWGILATPHNTVLNHLTYSDLCWGQNFSNVLLFRRLGSPISIFPSQFSSPSPYYNTHIFRPVALWDFPAREPSSFVPHVPRKTAIFVHYSPSFLGRIALSDLWNKRGGWGKGEHRSIFGWIIALLACDEAKGFCFEFGEKGENSNEGKTFFVGCRSKMMKFLAIYILLTNMTKARRNDNNNTILARIDSNIKCVLSWKYQKYGPV